MKKIIITIGTFVLLFEVTAQKRLTNNFFDSVGQHMKSAFFKGVVEDTRKNYFKFDSVEIAKMKCLVSAEKAMESLQKKLNSKKPVNFDSTVNKNVDRINEIINLANANIKASDLATDFSNTLLAQITSYAADYADLSKNNDVIDDYNYFNLIKHNYFFSWINQEHDMYNKKVDELNNLGSQLKQKISEQNGKLVAVSK